MSYRIEAVDSSSSANFAAAYGALAAEFAPRGELERREVVARWLDEPPARARGDGRHAAGADQRADGGEGGLRRTYHLLVARDDRGTLAGVRDCHVVLDIRHAIAVVYLAHVLVLPPFRRTGLAALFRSEPIAIARRAIADAGMDDRAADLLLAAEMEPASLDDQASVVRLVAYGRDGFSAISPAVLPYCQPDFRDLADLSDARPIPLLAVVRFLGHDGAVALPARLARAFVRHLYAVFATHVRPDHLAALERRTLDALDALDLEEVPLLPLPRTTDDGTTMAPLVRTAVMPFFREVLPEEPR